MHLTEQLRQSMLGDIGTLHENSERVCKIAQTLPVAGTRDDLENIDQRLAQLVLNTKKSFLSAAAVAKASDSFRIILTNCS